MTRPLKKMPAFGTIAAGATATVLVPLGLTYNVFYLRANVDAVPRDLPMADWGTYFGDIRVMVDGDASITIDAAELVSLNQYYGQSAAMVDGVLPLFLSLPWMRTIQGEDQTAYGTAAGSIESLSFEVDIKTGNTINSLELYAKQSVGTPFGPHLRIQRYRNPIAATGEVEITNINRGPYAMLGLHLNTAAVDKAYVEADTRKVIEFDRAIMGADLGAGGRVPQAGFTHFDFCPENRLAEALPMNLQDFRLIPDFTATGNFDVYAMSLQG